MKPCYVFDICAEVYLEARGASDRVIGPLAIESPYKYVWRPDVLPRPVDYVADFYRAGQRALKAPRLRGRRRMFVLFYCELADYHAARARLGISELTWSDWRDDIRRIVGKELLRVGIFPPQRYFNRSAPALAASPPRDTVRYFRIGGE
jgi:hypothetical protein